MPLPQWGVVGENDGFEDFPADIATIPSGGSIETLEPYGIPSAYSTPTQNDITDIVRVVLLSGYVIYYIDVARTSTSGGGAMFEFYFDLNSQDASSSYETFSKALYKKPPNDWSRSDNTFIILNGTAMRVYWGGNYFKTGYQARCVATLKFSPPQ